MAKDRGLDGSELLIYLNQQGLKYDPYIETFRDFINRLGLRGIIYNKEPHYLKEDVDLAIFKFKGEWHDRKKRNFIRIINQWR